MVLVWRVSCWNEEDLVQAELARRRASRLHVSGMYRIEGSAEKSDIQRFETLVKRLGDRAIGRTKTICELLLRTRSPDLSFAHPFTRSSNLPMTQWPDDPMIRSPDDPIAR
jgi:hypothetical protein